MGEQGRGPAFEGDRATGGELSIRGGEEVVGARPRRRPAGGRVSGAEGSPGELSAHFLPQHATSTSAQKRSHRGRTSAGMASRHFGSRAEAKSGSSSHQSNR